MINHNVITTANQEKAQHIPQIAESPLHNPIPSPLCRHFMLLIVCRIALHS